MAEFFLQIVAVFQATWWIIVPAIFWALFKSLYGRYVCILDFYGKQNEVLLEIIPPREVEKSPKVMERFFDALAATDAGVNKINEYCHCAGNPFFSLEIVGTEGVAHFYIRTPGALRDFIESSLYAQYPDVEIIEVEDYVYKIPQVIPNEEWTLKGFDLGLLKPDAYPIKTYKYFEEEITGTMIDPLASMLEAIGSLGPGQHMWLQYVIRADRPQWFDSWGKVSVEEFVGRSAKPISPLARLWYDVKEVLGGILVGWLHPPEFSTMEEPQSDDQPIEFKLTPGEKQTLTALEENISKPMFSVNMRLIVVGKKDFFTGVNLAGAMSSIKQFSDNWTNQFVPIDRSKVYADYVKVEERSAYRMRKILSRYRDRDDTGYPFHLSSAELATVFHLPDVSVEAPSLQRADSRRGTAPSNLPLH
jgi:vacuolar-type H+-ATPase subunit F/Vma7